MTRIAYSFAQVACALLVLRLFIPIPGLTYVALGLCIAGLAISIGVHVNAFRRARRVTVDPPLSPQQVMRNTRNALPTEYREWFDWTAEMAGFEEPKRPAAVGRPQWNEAQHKGHEYMTLSDMYGTVDRYCVDTRKHERAPKLPTVYRTCPDNTCNTTYGPGAGWTHTDQHTWVEMQT